MTAPAPTGVAATSTPRAKQSFPEIQALRTLAVGGVVIYHLFPGVLRGGYAGVDVFFVISGFLITAHLLRELDATGRIRFGAFYARRARRLLPAALLVLVVTGILTFLLLPERNWLQVLQEIGASAVYVENWVLAANSVDYLAQSTAIASPVQHYWSLSVEEQFYLVWPLLLVAGWWISSKLIPARRRAVLTWMLCIVFVGSLITSIALTTSDPGPAYFATTTRAWEFAAGGILGLLVARTTRFPRARAILSWVGLAAIAVTFLFYTGAVPFPSYTALLPVLGTVAVIAAGNPAPVWSPRLLMSWRPVQYIGDISYSLYLWHWPLAIFAIAMLGTVGAVGHVLVGVVAIVLAVLTKRYVEDPTRNAPILTSRHPRATLLMTAGAMAIVLVAVTGASLDVKQGLDSDKHAAAAALAHGDGCLGAGSLARPGCTTGLPATKLIPGTAQAPQDAVITPDCWSRDGDDTLRVCSQGPANSPALRVALIGDSHSNQYQAALEQMAKKYRWRVDFIGKSSCAWTTIPLNAPDAWNANCDSWRSKLNERILTGAPYDLIITSFSATLAYQAAAGETLEETEAHGFAEAWKPAVSRGTRVVAIEDNPRPRPDFLDCIDAHPSDAATACVRGQKEAFGFVDGQRAASAEVPGSTVIDLSEYFCSGGVCPTVIGNVIVYRDRDHLTSSYTRTLAPMLREAILAKTGLKEKPAA